MNLRELSDEELSDHLNAVLNEQERRQKLARIPQTVAELASQFRAEGGEQADLVAAISS